MCRIAERCIRLRSFPVLLLGATFQAWVKPRSLLGSFLQPAAGRWQAAAGRAGGQQDADRVRPPPGRGGPGERVPHRADAVGQPARRPAGTSAAAASRAPLTRKPQKAPQVPVLLPAWDLGRQTSPCTSGGRRASSRAPGVGNAAPAPPGEGSGAASPAAHTSLLSPRGQSTSVSPCRGILLPPNRQHCLELGEKVAWWTPRYSRCPGLPLAGCRVFCCDRKGGQPLKCHQYLTVAKTLTCSASCGSKYLALSKASS